MNLKAAISAFAWSLKHQTAVYIAVNKQFLVHVHVRYMSSPVCLSSVTFMRPTQAITIFGSVSMPFGTLAIPDLSVKILWRCPRVTPLLGKLNTRGIAEYGDFGPIEHYVLETVQDGS